MKHKIKHFLDLVMTVVLLFLMSYQITGEKAHEWLGMAMFVSVVAHNLLNMKWYAALCKGRYTFLRIIRTTVNVLLLVAMLGTMVSGILMNNYVFPLRISGTMASARVIHLAGSYWSFVLMSMHLGLHWGMIVSMFSKESEKSNLRTVMRFVLRIIAAALAAYGGYCFIKADALSYMTFRMHFAFLDFERAPALVLGDQLAMMGAWMFISYYFGKIIQLVSRSRKSDQNPEGENE